MFCDTRFKFTMFRLVSRVEMGDDLFGLNLVFLLFNT